MFGFLFADFDINASFKGDIMKVNVTGKSLQMPAMCACCGGAPDTEIAVADVRTSGNKSITSTWKIPYCSKCKEHVEYMKMGLLYKILCLVTLGLAAIGYVLSWKPMKRKIVQSRMCTPTCGSTEEPGFTTNGVTQTFDFPSQSFAQKFAQLNNGSIS
jgi:hypothetical protein